MEQRQRQRQRTRERTEQPQLQEASEAEIAAAIALILAGGFVVSNVAAAIAALLKLIPGLPELDADVSLPVARVVSRTGRGAPKSGEGEIKADAVNLSYRAHYAIEAMKRVATPVADGYGVSEAMRAELRHWVGHLEASEAREAGARLNDAAAKRWGPVLSWNHAASRTGGRDHRPSHVAADGANFDIRKPPRSTDGMLPGMAMHCDCLPGAPIPGGRMLT